MAAILPLEWSFYRFPISVEPTDELQTLRKKIKEYEDTIEDWKDELAKAKKVRILSLIQPRLFITSSGQGTSILFKEFV